MPGIGNQTEQDFMTWLFKQTDMPTATPDLQFSLHSADPGDTGANELSGGTSLGYARASLDPDVNSGTNVNYTAITEEGTHTVVMNASIIQWPAATGAWNSGSPILFFVGWGSGGTVPLFSGTINGGPGVTVLTGQTLQCFAGDFKAEVD
jgi:hypothetical protein